jgi:hypothetical protein
VLIFVTAISRKRNSDSGRASLLVSRGIVANYSGIELAKSYF